MPPLNEFVSIFLFTGLYVFCAGLAIFGPFIVSKMIKEYRFKRIINHGLMSNRLDFWGLMNAARNNKINYNQRSLIIRKFIDSSLLNIEPYTDNQSLLRQFCEENENTQHLGNLPDQHQVIFNQLYSCDNHEASQLDILAVDLQEKYLPKGFKDYLYSVFTFVGVVSSITGLVVSVYAADHSSLQKDIEKTQLIQESTVK